MMCADQEYGGWRFLSRIARTSDRLRCCQVPNETNNNRYSSIRRRHRSFDCGLAIFSDK